MRIWIYRAGMLYDVDDWSMDLAELQHKARVVVWTRGTRGTRGLGGVGCALEECAAKISTLYICISTYALLSEVGAWSSVHPVCHRRESFAQVLAIYHRHI